MQRTARIAAILIILFVTLPTQARTHNYEITVSDDLRRVHVQAELDGAEVLRARQGRSHRLLSASTCDGKPLDTRQNRIHPNGAACVHYTHRLEPMDERFRTADVLTTTTSEWLWLPTLENEASVNIRVHLPEGINAHLPFDPAGSHYVLRASPGSSRGLALFGTFTVAEIVLPDTKLRASLIGASGHEHKLTRWLTAAANDVWQIGGRFPNPQASVVVVDVPGSTGETVPFGHVIRDGSEMVRFFVQAESDEAALLGDWTATHEFAHLLLPYVREKWISEGFASYYQNVLLARRGVYSEEEAWRRLTHAFSRAREIDSPPSPNDTEHDEFWRVRMLIYWSGAALALMADAAWRAHDDTSLDTALARLGSCCLPSPDTWSGEALFAQLDALNGAPRLQALYERHADAPGLPPVEELYPALGIRIETNRVTLDDDAPLAAVRRAIMRGG